MVFQVPENTRFFQVREIIEVFYNDYMRDGKSGRNHCPYRKLR